MNKEIKAKWVTALRSGKYRRGKNYLESDNKYCCLGVLCKEMEIPFHSQAQFLPQRAARKAGVTVKTQKILAAINDGEDTIHCSKYIEQFPRYREGRGASFNCIANWIEKNL